MATPESIAAPREITELNPLMDLLNELNPALQNDPVFQKISGAGGFLRDLIEDPFNYLGGGAGAGLKGASVFLLARRAELEDLIKAVDTDPLLKGNQGLKKSYKKELDEVNQKIAENAKLKTQADELMADPSKVGVSLKSENDIAELATQIRRNEKAGTPLLFHGSNKGIGSLQDRLMYLSENATDPRFASYAKNKGLVMNPSFSKTLDVDNIPPKMDQVLTNLEMYRGRPSRGTPTKLDFDLDILRGNMQGIPNKVPPAMSKELAEVFTDQGYDALKFPPRTSKLMKDETSTYVALDPANTLKVFDELEPEQIPDLIQELLRNKFE
tara:strand:+ start:593 stop:1573 length:981 start_codon:yes stop_codon:yes gene_type:complete